MRFSFFVVFGFVLYVYVLLWFCRGVDVVDLEHNTYSRCFFIFVNVCCIFFLGMGV